MGVFSLCGRVVDEDSEPVRRVTVGIDSLPPRTIEAARDGGFCFEGLLGRSYQLRAHSPDGLAGTKQLLVDKETPAIELLMTAAAALEVSVVEGAGRRAVAGAQVAVEGQPTLLGTTDAEGNAVLTGMAPGRHILTASREGFAPARVAFVQARAGGPRRISLQLEPGVGVSGRVVDARGAGIADALVQAVQPSALSPDGVGAGHGARSDAKGDWRIAALPQGTWRLCAVHTEYSPALSESVEIVSGGREVGPVQLVMREGARLEGQVFLASGSPAALATVGVRAAGPAALVGVRRSVQADENGWFVVSGLPHRQVWVEARSGGAAAAEQLVDLSGGAGDVTLLLEAPGVIRGVVLSSAGEPLAGAQVAAIPEDAARRVALAESRVGQYAADVSDEVGQFQLSGLLPGTYRLRASSAHAVQSPTFWMGASTLAETGATDVRLTVEQAARLHGRVELADGSVPEALTVALSGATPSSFQGTEGAFELDDVPPGNHVLTVASPGVAPQHLDTPEITPGEDVDLGVIVLPAGFSIAGIVQGPEGAPVAGARVSAGPRLIGDGRGAQRPAAKATTDEQGSFTVHGLEAGSVMVMAEHEALGRSVPLSLNLTSEVGPVLLELKPASALEGIVTRDGKAVEGAAVVAAPGGSSTVRLAVATQADGRYRFERLSEGPYVLTAGLRLSPTLQLAHRVPAVVPAEQGPIDIDTSTSGPEVTLSLAAEDIEATAVAQLQLVSGAIRASTVAELEASVSRSPGQSWVAVSVRGAAIVLPNVDPGSYSLCTTLLRGNIDDAAFQERARANAGASSVRCQLVEVTSTPAQQQVVAEPWSTAVVGSGPARGPISPSG